MHQEEKGFLTYLDDIDDAVLAFDKDYHYIYINRRGLEIINKTKGEVLGKKLEEVIPDIKKTTMGKNFFKAVKLGKPSSWEYYSSSAKQWLKAHVYPTPEKGCIVFYTDVTQQHTLEASLNEKGILLDLSYDAIQMQDEDNRIFYWNKGAERVYGWKKEEVLGKIGYQLLETKFPGGYKKFFKELKKNKSWKGLLFHKTKDKKSLVVRSTWSLLEKNGKIQILEINRDITEEEYIRQQLVLSEKKFRSLIENSSDGILITDENLHVQYISPSIKKILGFDPSTLLHLPIKQFIDENDFPLVIKNHRKLLKGDRSVESLYRVKNRKGEVRWLEVKSTNLLEDPAVQGIVTNFRDVTDEKLYQNEIENKNRKITEILENFSYAYYGIDKNWRYSYVNKAGEILASKKREKMLGKRVQDIFPEAEGLISDKVAHEVMENRIAKEYDIYFPTYKKWYHNYVYPTSEGIAIYAIDVTEKKHIEQEIENTKQELDAILKNMPNGVMVQDREGNLVYANDAAVKITGYSSMEEMMQAPRLDYIYKFDLRDEYGKKFLVENLPGRTALKDGSSAQVTVKITNKKTREQRWISITSNVIRGNKTLIINVIEDVTDLKEADVRKNDFISMASHELKTPLTSLKVYMHLLSEQENLNSKRKKEYIDKANEQVEKLQLLVSEMLDQSTIQQGKLSLHLQEIYFDFFLKEFVKVFQQTVEGFKISLKGVTNSIVTIDKYRIEQVLANILSNAIKYSKDRKEISISLKNHHGFISLSIKDFGIGIPPTEIDNIFMPYYRVIGKKENTFPGMGMGLYISKDIIEKHGGEISVVSTLGKGTTFTITLPTLD